MTRTCLLQLFVFGIAVEYAALEVYDNLDQTYIKELKLAFERGGNAALTMLIMDKLDEWKETEINIAVTGETGVGKSSFVNAFRGLTADDDGAAEVGVIETTKVPTAYPHPENNKLVLWDLPGAGTPKYPRDTYFDNVKGNKYDFFIIISADRFTENDLMLAKILKEKNKAFYFVRNKIGQDLDNDKRDHPKTHDPKKVLKMIRMDCMKNIQSNSRHLDTTVYLIDTFDIGKFDFNVLSARIFTDAPDLKRETLAYSVTALSEELVKRKKEFLLERAHKVAIASAVAGAVPIPGLDVAVDIGLFLTESQFYLSQFGLDDKSLLRFANKFGMTVEELQTSLNLRSRLIEFSAKGLLNYFAKLGMKTATSYVAAGVFKYILPGVGSIIGAAASYTVTYRCLENLLNVMAEDAINLNSLPNMKQSKYFALN